MPVDDTETPLFYLDVSFRDNVIRLAPKYLIKVYIRDKQIGCLQLYRVSHMPWACSLNNTRHEIPNGFDVGAPSLAKISCLFNEQTTPPRAVLVKQWTDRSNVMSIKTLSEIDLLPHIGSNTDRRLYSVTAGEYSWKYVSFIAYDGRKQFFQGFVVSYRPLPFKIYKGFEDVLIL